MSMEKMLKEDLYAEALERIRSVALNHPTMTTRTNVSLGIYDRATIFWSWLFPLSYLIHIAEEYWGGEGYPAYILRLRGVHMSTARFLAAQSAGFILVTIGVILARRLKFLPMMLVILGTVIAGNALTHSYNYSTQHPQVWTRPGFFNLRLGAARNSHHDPLQELPRRPKTILDRNSNRGGN